MLSPKFYARHLPWVASWIGVLTLLGIPLFAWTGQRSSPPVGDPNVSLLGILFVVELNLLFWGFLIGFGCSIIFSVGLSLFSSLYRPPFYIAWGIVVGAIASGVAWSICIRMGASEIISPLYIFLWGTPVGVLSGGIASYLCARKENIVLARNT